MKKRILSSVLLLTMVLSLAGCKGKDSDNKNETQNNETADTSEDFENIEVEEYDVEKLVTLGEYKNLKVNTYVSEEDVDKEIDNILKANPMYEEIKDRKVKDGDTVNIDFVGKKDGVEFEGGSAKGFDLVIGSNSFIDGFEEGLIGTKAGDTKDLDLKFPEDYQNSPDLAGQAVVFTVTVNYIKGEAIDTEFNDAFVKRVSNGSSNTTDEFREETKNKLYTSNVSNMVDTAFMQVLESSTVSEVPEGLVELMKLRIDASYKMMAEQNGFTDFGEFLSMFAQMTVEDYEKKLDETAVTYVEQQLITEAIAKKENITVTDEEYDKYLEEYLKDNKMESVEDMEKYSKEVYKSDLNSLINEAIILDKVFALINESVEEVNDKPQE